MVEKETYSEEQVLIRSWFWLHVVSVVAIAMQYSQPATILGRYSPTSFLILVFFVITLPVAWLMTRWLRNNIENLILPKYVFGALFIVCIIALFGIWAFHIGPTRSYAVVRLYATFVIFTVGIWSVRHLELPDRAKYIPPAIGIISAVLLFFVAMNYPDVKWTDEGYTASAAWGYIQTGRPLLTMFYPLGETVGYSMMYRGLGLWFSVFGISLAAGRTYTYIVGLIALTILLVTTRKKYGWMEAWSTFIVGLYGFVTINYLYPDVEIAVLLAAAFGLFVLAETTGKAWLHLFVGILLGLSVDGHPVAYRLGITFGAAYLLEWAILLRRERKWRVYRPAIYLALGGALGFGMFISFYLITNPYFAQLASGSPFFPHDLQTTFQILLSQFDSAITDVPLLLGMGLLGAVSVLRRNGRFERLLLISFFGAALILALIYERHRPYYLMHSLAPLSLLAAAGLYKLKQGYPARSQMVVMIGSIALIATASVGMLTDRVTHNSNFGAALSVARAVRSIVPADAVLVGVDPFFFELADYPHFLDIIAPVHRPGFTPESVGDGQNWVEAAPDAVVIVHGYPLVEHVEDLAAYVRSQPDMQLVRCWIVDTLGKVELFMRTAAEDADSVVECQPLEISP